MDAGTQPKPTKTNMEKPAFKADLGSTTVAIVTDQKTGAARLELSLPWNELIADDLLDLGVSLDWSGDLETCGGVVYSDDDIPADKIDAVRKVLTNYSRHVYAKAR